MLKTRFIYKILYFLGAVVLVYSCQQSKEDWERNRKTRLSVTNGELLAKQYCANCHEFPEPTILPRHYWGKLLPIMGFYLGAGRDKYQFADEFNPVAKMRLAASNIFPDSSLLTKKEWTDINNYYFYKSPLELDVEETPNFDMELKQFRVEPLPWKNAHEGLSYLNFDSSLFEVGVYDENESYYMKLDTDGNELEKLKINSPLVDVSKKNDEELLLLIGSLKAVDEPLGAIVSQNNSLEDLIKPLERPVNIIEADFDNDGIDEILVAEFGKNLGGINIYTKKEPIRKLSIHPLPGAVKIIVKDVDNDGLKDFYALVAQQDESLYLFKNTGNLKFNITSLLSLPFYYGTTSFELLDFDGDGDEDVVCSSGDSGDYGIILKPFHGVRLFENLGNYKYKQVWFHPQQGAYGTASADYDNDGDIDIASIGYFASHLNRNKELFIYFENRSTKKNKWQFKPIGYLPKAHDSWMLITNADIDNDGDLDILLGANSMVLPPEKRKIKYTEWREHGGMVTVLKNNLYD